jgi:5,10-methylenetetrahydromethanopterin reductase
MSVQGTARGAVEFWRHGAWQTPLSSSGEYAARLEALGWDGIAVGENPSDLADPYACLALAAARTTRIKLGSGVLVPIRHPLQAASGIAAIHAISGGRTQFSLGRGDGAMRSFGRGPMPVGEFRQYLDRLQGYLRKDTVMLDDFPSSLVPMYTVDPSYDIGKPRIDVSATGPKMIRLAAQLADGLTFAVGADAKRLARCVELARSARADAGLPLEGFSLGAYVPTAVTADDRSDIAAARRPIRMAAMVHARFSAYDGSALADLSEDERRSLASMVDRLKARLDEVGGHVGDIDGYPEQALDDEFIDRFAVVGPPDYCAERYQELLDVGINRVLVLTRVSGIDREDTNQERIAKELLPLLRR